MELERLGEDVGAVSEKNSYLFDPLISRQRALIQALAAYPKTALGPEEPSRLIQTLIKLYRNDPDGGVQLVGRAGPETMGYVDRLNLEPGQPPRAGEAIRRRWYVNREGQTMVLIDGPALFDMGSPRRTDSRRFSNRSIDDSSPGDSPSLPGR